MPVQTRAQKIRDMKTNYALRKERKQESNRQRNELRKERKQESNRQEIAEAETEEPVAVTKYQDPLQPLFTEAHKQQELREKYQNNLRLKCWHKNTLFNQCNDMNDTSSKAVKLNLGPTKQYDATFDGYRILTELLFNVRINWEEIYGPNEIMELLLFKDKINAHCKTIEADVNACRLRLDQNTRNTLNALLDEMGLTIEFIRTYISNKSMPDIIEELLAISSLIKQVHRNVKRTL
jgi:hypothetical protein